MTWGSVTRVAGTEPDDLPPPGPSGQSTEVPRDVGQGVKESRPGGLEPAEDADVLLVNVVQMVVRVVTRRARRPAGATRVQAGDLANETLALLLAERRPRAFWEGLRPTAAGTEEAQRARRAVFRAVDRALWRLRDLRRVEISRTDDTPGTPGRNSRKRVLVPKFQGLPDHAVLADPGGFDAEQVDICLDVWDALEALKPLHRRVLIARIVHKDTWAEVTRTLQSTDKQVRTTFQQAMSALSVVLRTYGGPGT